MALLDFTVSGSPDELNKIADQVDRVAEAEGWSQQAIFALQVSLDEWVSNVFKYSYDDATDRPIRILLDQDDRGIVASVEDEGRPFDLTQADIPDTLGDTLSRQREGGMGLFMMRHLLSGIEYRQNAGRNIVTLRVKP
jgi:anti-sigma regulatory factor (Ser/Thr protein kinase)